MRLDRLLPGLLAISLVGTSALARERARYGSDRAETVVAARREPTSRYAQLPKIMGSRVVRGAILGGVWAILTRRILQYGGRRPAARALIRELDFTTRRTDDPSRPGLFALFSSEAFDRLAKDREALGYLADLRAGLERAADTGERLDLWSFTLKRAKTPRRAIEWLGVFLQDTTPGGQVPLLPDPDARADLDAAIHLMRDPTTPVDLYPPGFESDDRRPYHFYVLALAAQRMRAAGVPAKSAFAAGLLLESEYKIHKSLAKDFMETMNSRGLRAAIPKLPRMLAAAWRGPDNQPLPEGDQQMNDAIYLGYAGSYLGAGLAADKQLDAQRFKAAMSRPRDALSDLVTDPDRPLDGRSPSPPRIDDPNGVSSSAPPQ